MERNDMPSLVFRLRQAAVTEHKDIDLLLGDAAHSIETLRASLKDANDLCRSAYQIAERTGNETNWTAFTERLHESLERQSNVMYPDVTPNMKVRGGE